MAKNKIDYSELVTALKQHEQGKANDLLQKLIVRLCRYLKTVMQATDQDAEDAVHEAFLNTYQKIMEGKIRNEQYIYSYLIRACRNKYLDMVKGQSRLVDSEPDTASRYQVEPARQIENLLDEERQKVLEFCLSQLRAKSRKFIEYYFTYPESTSKATGTHFNISEANARTKKSRLLKTLSECVKKHMNR